MRLRTPNKRKVRKVQRRKAFMQVTKNLTNDIEIEIPNWMLFRLMQISCIRQCRKERTGFYLKNKSQ